MVTLTQIIEAGYPQYRQAAGLPSWLLPESQMARITGELGDEGIQGLAKGLIDTGEAETPLAMGTEVKPVSSEAWQEGMSRWQPISQVAPGALALLAAWESLLGCYRQGRLHIKPEMVCRALSVLFLAPLVSQGKNLTESLAGVLEIDRPSVAELITSYTEKVMAGDMEIVDRVEGCISSDGVWSGLSAGFLRQAGDFPFMPKAIAITPSLTPQVAGAVASLIKGGAK